MPGYGDIGGSWRELNGGGYANIGGSWRQISEGYQNRGGVWEKVFPNYADYGDSVELISSGYINSYGYKNTNSNGYATQSGIEGYTSSHRSSSSGRTVGGTVIDASTFNPQWFATTQPFDLRGYNYMAYVLYAYISTTESSSSPRHNFQIRPIVSFADAPNALNSNATTVITPDSYSSSTVEYSYGYYACTFMDLSNCKVSDLYLRVGYTMGSTWDNSSQNAYAYLDLTRSNCVIWLYKDKSSCNINGSDYSYSFTLTY